jgi:lysophospholipase L1-like esterase
VTLVTTLLQPAIPTDDLIQLYFRRWSVELHFREIKIALNLDVLRCKSPAMIERELLMHLAPGDWSEDKLHPSQSGYDKLATVWFDTLKEQLPKPQL